MYSKQLHFHSCQIWNLTWQRTKPTTPHLSLPSSLTWIKHLNCLELSTELMSLGYKTREKIAGCQKAAQIVHLRASQRAWCISARRCRIFYGQTSPNKKPWMQGGFVCACVRACVRAYEGRGGGFPRKAVCLFCKRSRTSTVMSKSLVEICSEHKSKLDLYICLVLAQAACAKIMLHFYKGSLFPEESLASMNLVQLLYNGKRFSRSWTLFTFPWFSEGKVVIVEETTTNIIFSSLFAPTANIDSIGKKNGKRQISF